MSNGVRRTVFAAGLAGCLLITGCSATVAGSPVADPSAVPKPETGSFATTARTISGTVSEDLGAMLEGYRMVETVPFLYRIDPALHFQGHVAAGSSKGGGIALKNTFGDAAAKAFGDAIEVGVTVSAESKPQGTKYDPKDQARSVTVAALRTASPDVASAAVSSDLLAAEKDFSGKDTPEKKRISIPGHSDAIGYTQTWEYSGTVTIAFLSHKQYVLGVYGDFSAEQIRTYFDEQIKGLDGFTPTPVDKLTTLKADEPGVARLTLAPSKGDGGYSRTARQAVMGQTDVARSVTTFAAAGVDVMGSGGSTVYRAKDADGAKHVYDEFLAETKEAYPKAQVESVKGAPGAVCLTYSTYEGSTSKRTYCMVATGRYLAEFTATQRNQAVQGIGAQYLILAAEK